ncbi:MAG: DUF3604 domain-containing protein [Gammaproteobacteria bacterium AqS3]|nr:DUF3604 domain-containing protein [Gammaproteobacteria bacterium AqS3]
MRTVLKMVGATLLVALCAGLIFVVGLYLDLWSRALPAESPTDAPTPPAVIESRTATQQSAARNIGAPDERHILFGDLHVHTTFSFDAFLWSLPMLGGSGPHSVADACDFARFCAGLDFWSITDHAEASTQRRWSETIDSVRSCSALGEPAGQPPSMVTYLGFEWTQVGQSAEEHYGHKNVIFRGLDDDQIAPRPIASGGVAQRVLRDGPQPPALMPALDPANAQRYIDFRGFVIETQSEPECDENATPDTACYTVAERPDLLFEKLDRIKGDTIVIPHGTSWGFYTPPTSSLAKQLAPAMRPERQELMEVMSGHGNSEEYRDYVSIIEGEDGELMCAPVQGNFTPMCRRVGQIIEARCLDRDEDAKTCSDRAEKAMSDYLRMGMTGHRGLKGEAFEDYLDADQCMDCFLPSFSHRPKGSVQFALAASNFDEPDALPRRFRFGFIASSDNHRSRPGTGYKPVDRRLHTEANGAVSDEVHAAFYPWQGGEVASDVFEYSDPTTLPADFGLAETERQASFWTTGGLAAVHADARDRDSIWEAMRRKETYGTSGPRILLWFDFIGDDGKVHPMGSQLNRGTEPRFRVRALGAHEQKPGCPDYSANALGAERLAKLCSNECHNPGDARVPITHIDIVRIRPQKYAGEEVGQLIEDPWRRLECPADGGGCTVEFSDPQYSEYGRDTVYYARAVQQPTPTVNGLNLRCSYDEEGRCVEVNPCYGERHKTADEDFCLADVAHRAWSSPIFLDFNHAKLGLSQMRGRSGAQ